MSSFRFKVRADITRPRPPQRLTVRGMKAVAGGGVCICSVYEVDLFSGER